MIIIMKIFFDVKNLTASKFLSSTGKTVKLASDEVKDTREEINFSSF